MRPAVMTVESVRWFAKGDLLDGYWTRGERVYRVLHVDLQRQVLTLLPLRFPRLRRRIREIKQRLQSVLAIHQD